MVKHQILFVHEGINSGTAKTPRYVVTAVEGNTATLANGQTVDLTEQKTCCLYHDDDRPVNVDYYAVGEVELPEWLSAEEWLRDTTKWKYVWGFDVPKTWPEAWQRGVAGFGQADKLACVKLLNTKSFRSDFRRSLRDRLVEWLETPAGERRYDSPFSDRQWDCLVNRYVKREAEQISSALYRAR